VIDNGVTGNFEKGLGNIKRQRSEPSTSGRTSDQDHSLGGGHG
jgi:hypothetical protein